LLHDGNAHWSFTVILAIARVAIRVLSECLSMYAGRDIVLPMPSVRLSVCPMPVVCLYECTCRDTLDDLVGHHSTFFEPHRRYSFQGEPSAGALNTGEGVGKFGKYRFLSWIGPQLLWNTNMKS